MQRINHKYRPSNKNDFKKRLLLWANKFKIVSYLESNDDHSIISSGAYNKFECIFAIDAITTFAPCETENFRNLQCFIDSKKDWLFGHINYDIKNELEKLESDNFDGIDFPKMFFFQPRYLIFQTNDTFELSCFPNDSTIFEDIEKVVLDDTINPILIDFSSRISKLEYFNQFNEIQRNIQAGNIYEMNFCFEFFSENANISPTQVWENLNKLSYAPMSCFYKINDKFVLCSSPERFIKKEGAKIIAQPIKGTAKRSASIEEDHIIKLNLKSNLKEQTENVMIVDLVRNDLSKIAIPASVKVEELFGVYTFKQVHQLISTISCEVDEETKITDIISSNFPMGSMTGAPKVSAMKLIEEFEFSKRGIYSGAIGYLDPTGNFDFNVVIRSLIYDSTKKYLSYSVGSAITALANAEEEYNECLLKAKVIQELFV